MKNMSIAAQLLNESDVVLDAVAATRDEAIALVGALLVGSGAVEQAYVGAMQTREADVSTYLGEGIARPHGSGEARHLVRRDALVFVRFPDGVTWDGEQAQVAIGIAATDGRHMQILAELAALILDPTRAAVLRDARTPQAVIAALAPPD